ncbi:N-acetyltransferase family protein [Acinetobacter gyllenbergii]|uniref:GNAT family N-acetyltransferase n=1 Tax=Acinetobacter gyllenbergii TaxID=134534 RepID=UPI003AF5B01A
MKLRLATKDDVPVLIQIGKDFIKESPNFRERSYVEQSAGEHFSRLINGEGVIFVIENDGHICGGFVGGIGNDWINNQKIAFDYVLYVKPDYRSTKAAYMLVKAFIDWAQLKGADRIQCGTTTGVEAASCINLYKKFGFKDVGVLLDLELKNV